MAVTKIKPIRGTVNKALAYILDPQKTDDAFYVSSYGCAASDAAAKEFEWTRNLAVQQGMQMPKVLARHLIQSFDIGEVTPEEAHEVGKQLADEWLKGKYEYVIATHIDKGHCHNHIIFNAVNYVDFHAYRSNKRTYRELRQLSDEICKEHGLSVIPPSQNKGMDYKEYTEAKRGTSWKQKLKQTIDRLVITAKDYDDFLWLMQEAGYEIKTGKYISSRAEGQERFTRSKTIGGNYTEERIKERIAGRTPRRSQRQTVPKGISLIGDSNTETLTVTLWISGRISRRFAYKIQKKSLCRHPNRASTEALDSFSGHSNKCRNRPLFSLYCWNCAGNIITLGGHSSSL